MRVEAGSVGFIEPILDLLPGPLLLIEPGTARVLYANPAAHRLAGGPLPLAGGASEYAALYAVYDEDGRRLPGHEHPGVRAARGERIRSVLVDWATPAGRRSVSVSADTVRLPGAEEVVLLSFEDVSELQAARRRAALLAEATSQLVRSLDHAEVAAAVGRLAVPAYADWCFVELLQPDGSIAREVIAHADPSLRALADEYDRRHPLDPDAPFGSPRVIRTGEPELMPEISDELLVAAAQDEQQLAVLRELGLRSSLIVPLRARERVLGDLALVFAESGRRFGEDDVPVVQELADRCALALDNARLYAELREAEAAARRAGEEVRTILAGVADAITVQAPDGRLIYANEAAVAMVGFASVEEMLAAPIADLASRFEMLDEHGERLAIEELPGRRALAGEAPEPLIVRSRHIGERETRWTRVKAKPVHDDEGRVRLAINVIEDITELKRAEQAQRFLAEAGRVLSGSLDYEETLAAVARLAVPDIADWCAVEVLSDGAPRRVAVAHADPAKVQMAEEVARRYPPDPAATTGVAGVLRSGRAELYPEITDEMLVAAARDAEHLALLRSIGMHSAMIVPMALRGEVVGAMTFISAEAGRSFGAADLALAENLGSRAAAAVENSRLYQARSAIARTLQASLLPPALPDVPRFELAALYRAAGHGFEVGGDFYDVFSTAEDQWYAVIGDVCGKGAEAAAVTGMARYTIRTAAVRRRSPAAILRLLSEAMMRQDDSAEAPGRFCTIACLHLDLSHSPARTTVACGGHPLPVVVRADGRAEELGVPGTLLGLVERPELQDSSGELHEGDTVVLYTDGLTEAGAPEYVWSPAELGALLRQGAGRTAQQLVDHAVGAALGQQPEPRDDIAALALRATR